MSRVYEFQLIFHDEIVPSATWESISLKVLLTHGTTEYFTPFICVLSFRFQ